MSTDEPNPSPDHRSTPAAVPAPDAVTAARDIAEVSAVEVITTAAVHLMSAAAVRCGLEEGPGARQNQDLAEARVLISALAGLVVASAPDLGSQHARSLRDGLRTLQLAFREASVLPDPPGQGPGERLTGAVTPAAGTSRPRPPLPTKRSKDS